MYLEQPRVENVFPESRLALLAPLTAQAATAVENALLYAELAASNVRLEQQVKQRTAELEAAKGPPTAPIAPRATSSPA